MKFKKNAILLGIIFLIFIKLNVLSNEVVLEAQRTKTPSKPIIVDETAPLYVEHLILHLILEQGFYLPQIRLKKLAYT